MQLTSVALALLVGVASGSVRPDVIDLPRGFQPEGIVFVDSWTAYVSSIGSGAIWKGNMKTGEGEVVVPAVGSMALGLDYDKRTGYLYVGGGDKARPSEARHATPRTSGTLRVYDRDHNLVLDTVMDPSAPISFVNSVVVAKDYVYATDSFRSQFYAIPLDDDARPKNGANTMADIVRISGGGFPGDVDVFVNYAQSIKSNGIVLSDDEKMMIICIMSTSEIFLVDSETGEAKRIDLRGEYISGDGLEGRQSWSVNVTHDAVVASAFSSRFDIQLRRGNTIWLVENGVVTGVEAIHEVSLSKDWTCGKVTRVFYSELLDAPTTAARKNNGIYAVNARLFVPPEESATATYEVVRIDRDEAEADC